MMMMQSSTRWVATPIFAVRNLDMLVVWVILDSLDALDGRLNVGKVGKRAVLFSQTVDHFQLAVLREIAADLVLRQRVWVVNVANVDIARSTCLNSKLDRRTGWTRVLPPSNLETPVVNHDARVGRQMVECKRRVGIDKGDKRNVLFRNVSHVLQNTSANVVADLFCGGVWVDVAEVDGAVAQLL